ncbi:MAG: hypothetical protein UIM53_01615 [Acutalibacteraceae bacterium]|nr:hypothetical protein [Acutalibacteraceae bacterium]
MYNSSNIILDKSCIYLNVFFNDMEIAPVPADILTDARNRFFIANGKKIKDKVFFSANGIKYSFAYQIDTKGKFKWKATANGTTIEEAVAEPAGYIILYKNISGLVYKKTYFNHSHIWQKTEYFEAGKNTPSISLMPWLNDDRAAIAMYDGDTSFPQILYGLPLPENNEDIHNAVMLCNPQVSATVNNVTYFFGDDELEEQWNSILRSCNTVDNLSISNKTNEKEYFCITMLNQNSGYKNLADTNEFFSVQSVPFNSPITQNDMLIENTTVERVHTTNNKSESYPINPQKENKVIYPVNTTNDTFTKRTNENNADKTVMISQKEKGYYFGSLDTNNNRSGYGRVQTSKGKTLYEGEFLNDMKNGFGVTFFKSGKVSHIGNYINNNCDGFGLEFRATDGSITAAQFKDNAKEFISAKFDKTGKLTYAGSKYDEDECSINFNTDNGEIFIAKFNNGEPLYSGTIISADGTLLYTGDYKNGNKDGNGMLFNPDGTIKYSGEFKRNLYSGIGTLTYDNGNVYTGEFSAGYPNGKGELRTEQGEIIYTGQWKKGLYNGDGRLYNKDGSYSDGKFVNGVAKGKLTIYDEKGLLKYNGLVLDDKPDGNGICYDNGKKVYDGQLSRGIKSGTGRLYEDNECVYMGSFENDMFCGFGISYKNSQPVYCGMWQQNKYNGAGLLSVDQNTLVAGNFINGVPNGRINVIRNNVLVQECIYNNGECEYMREYSQDGTSVLYDGNIKNNVKEGMGCTFTEYGEKLFEGIFKNGEPYKSMKVSFREMPVLEYIAKLKDTDYEKFRNSKEFVVEQPMMSGVYSGQLKNGVPDGKGTILYVDHRYTGNFYSGSACGNGIIYCGDGTVIKGVFTNEPQINTTAISFSNVIYNQIK